MTKFLTFCSGLIALYLAAAASCALAQDMVLPPLPKAMDKVDVYLLTIGRGDQAESLFGHTILRVVDHTSGADLNFNWGIFDFSGPNFIWNFYVGNLNYTLAISDFASVVSYYYTVEQRSVVQNRVVLTAHQKELLLARLWDNARPENVHYQYSQLFDNCATRPRDHLDVALSGKLKAFFAPKAAPGNFRSYVMRDAASSWWVHLGIDLVTTSVMDVQRNLWEAMFLPRNLRDALLTMPALDDALKPIPGHNLLEDSTWVLSYPEPLPTANPYFYLVLGLIAPLGLVGLRLQGRPSERQAARQLGLVSVIYGLWSAVTGTLFLFNWFFSHYLEAKHNALLWLVWPVDWLFTCYGLRLWWTGSRPLRLTWLSQLMRLLATLHLLALALASVLLVAGIFTQQILPSLASTGLAGLFYYTMLIRFGSAREL